MQAANETLPLFSPEQALAELFRLGYQLPSDLTLVGAVGLPEGLRFVFSGEGSSGPFTLFRDGRELATLCSLLEEPPRPDPLYDPELAALQGGQPLYKLRWMRSKGLARSGPEVA